MSGLSVIPVPADNGLRLLVLDEQGLPVAEALFFNHRPDLRTIEVTATTSDLASLTETVIGQVLSYPFHHLQCRRVTAATPRKAASARRFLETYGFRREGLIREGFGTDDLVVYGLLRKEWDRAPWSLASREGNRSDRSSAEQS